MFASGFGAGVYTRPLDVSARKIQLMNHRFLHGLNLPAKFKSAWLSPRRDSRRGTFNRAELANHNLAR